MTQELERLIPHRGPMLLLNRILYTGMDKATCEVVIEEQSLFCVQGAVPAWVGIEYMAQTIATYAGAIDLANGEKEPSIGFLLGCRNYKVEVPEFTVGQHLIIEAFPVFIDDAMGNFKATISIDGRLVAETTMNTYKPNAEMIEFLKAGKA